MNQPLGQGTALNAQHHILKTVIDGRIINQLTHSALTGIDTGYYDLNDMTGGLQNTDLVILAARPSMGKTSLGLNICAHAAIRGHKKVAVFSLEMSAEQLVRRLLASEARINQKQLMTGYLANGLPANGLKSLWYLMVYVRSSSTEME